MKKIVVQGGGLVGRAIALDLHEQFKVTIIDNNSARLTELKAFMPNIHTINFDFATPESAVVHLNDADLIIGALPPAIGFHALRMAIAAGKNTVSVSTLLEGTKELDILAKQKGVTAVIDAGIAPGLSNLIVGHHVKQMEIQEYECLFGGLPQKTEWPLYHRDFYPPEELLSEYLKNAKIVEQGQVTTLTPLNHIKHVEFPGLGTLAAIHYNGLGSLMQTMRNKIPKMRQKILRFPQHLNYIRSLQKCGLLSVIPIQIEDSWIRPIDITTKALESHMSLGENDSDTIALRITLRGEKNSYVYQLLDQYDHAGQVSAMSRTTGYTCSAISRLVLNGLFTQKGMISPEIVGMQSGCFTQIIDDLRNRGIFFDVEHIEHENDDHDNNSTHLKHFSEKGISTH